MQIIPLTPAACIAAAALAMQPSIARATDEDVQFWLNATAKTDLSKTAQLTLDLSQRFRDEEHGNNTQLARASVDFDVSDNAKLGGGLTYSHAGSSDEIRPHQQVTLQLKAIDVRFRLEERFIEGRDRMGLRLRTRAQYAKGLSSRIGATASLEWLWTLRQTGEDSDVRTSQLRITANVTHAIGKDSSLAVGYLLILVPQTNQPDSVSHVPQVSYIARF